MHLHRLFLFGLLSLSTGISYGQGFLYDPIAFRKVPPAPMPSGEKEWTNMPLRVDLSGFSPKALRQGKGQNICVAISTAYGAYATQRAAAVKFASSPDAIAQQFALSPIYPLISNKRPCTDTQTLDAVARDVADAGGVWYRDYPTLTCGSPLPKQAKTERLITTSFKLFKRDSGDVVFNTRFYLSRQIPVIVGLHVAEDLFSFRSDYYKPDPDSTPIDHAVVVVGYDEYKKAFQMQNSYGSEWSQKGFFWMKYTDFEKAALAGIILALPNNENKLGGRFQLIHLGTENNSLKTDTLQPQLVESGLYSLPRKDWRVNDQFHLFVRNTQPGEHICVFSFNLTDAPYIHYPRPKENSTATQPTIVPQPNQKANPRSEPKFGAEVIDLIPANNFGLVIPDEDTALVIKKPATDYMCVLYSTQPIATELPAILERIKQTPGDILQRIRTALGSRLATGAIRYNPSQMDFSATISQGNIVPIILEVKSVK